MLASPGINIRTPSSSQIQNSVPELLVLLESAVQEVVGLTASSSRTGQAPLLSKQDPGVRNLLRVLDALLTKNIKSIQKDYWRAVKEFSHKDLLSNVRRKWDPKSERAFSLAWLYETLNERSLEWLLLGMAQPEAQTILRKFYDPGAFLLAIEAIKLAAQYLEPLENVPFNLAPPTEHTPVPAISRFSYTGDGQKVPLATPAKGGVGELTVSDVKASSTGTSSGEFPIDAPDLACDALDSIQSKRESVVTVKRVNRRKARNNSQSDLLNPSRALLSSTPKTDSFLSNPDRMLQEILVAPPGKRESPEGNENPEPYVSENSILSSLEEVPNRGIPMRRIPQPRMEVAQSLPMAVPPPKTAEARENTFEDQVLARLHRVSSVLSTRELVTEDEQLERGKVLLSKEPTPDSYEGEIQLDTGEIVQLAVEVFIKEGEQFYKLFRVFAGHESGTPIMRFLLITNYAIYSVIIDSNKGEGHNHYKTLAILPLKEIDFVSVGLHAQAFVVFLANKRGSLALGTASEMLTRSIMSSLELAVRRCGTRRDPPAVLTDATPQRLVLEKWVSNELKIDKAYCPLFFYSLVYWDTRATKSRGPNSSDQGSRSSYLYTRNLQKGGWFAKRSDWSSNYFILRNRKLYQFQDSSCKLGLKVYDCRKDIIGCRESETVKDHQHCLELIPADREGPLIQLSAQTKHDAQQWMHAILCSISAADTAEDEETIACFMLITQDFLLFGQENSNLGFVRTLACLSLSTLEKIWKLSSNMRYYLILTFASTSEFGCSVWWVSFRNHHELEKAFKCIFDQTGLSCEELNFDEDMAETPEYLAEEFASLRDQWRVCAQC